LMTTFWLSVLKFTLARPLKDHLVGPELESQRKLSTGNHGLQHLFCTETGVCALNGQIDPQIWPGFV
jgi:hypothetical protein